MIKVENGLPITIADLRYLKLTGGTLTGDLLIKPTAGSLTSLGIYKSDGTTPVLITDTTNGIVTNASLKITDRTSGQVLYTTAGGQVFSNTGLKYDGTNLQFPSSSCTGDLYIGGILGGGPVGTVMTLIDGNVGIQCMKLGTGVINLNFPTITGTNTLSIPELTGTLAITGTNQNWLTTGTLGAGAITGTSLNAGSGLITTTGSIKSAADSQGLYTGASDDIRIYHDSTNSYVTNATGTFVFDNNDLTTASSLGKIQFLGDYIPTSGTGATTVGNSFTGTLNLASITAGTANYTGNLFTATLDSMDTTGVGATINMTGTNFTNTLDGNQTAGFRLWSGSMTGTSYTNNITGNWVTATGINFYPMVIANTFTATTTASHQMKGLDLTTTYNAANSVNQLYGYYSTTNFTTGTSVGNVNCYTGVLGITGTSITAGAAYFYASPSGLTEATVNTTLAANKRLIGYDFAGATTWNMAARDTYAFHTDLLNDAFNFSFVSEGANGWMYDNAKWLFGTAKDVSIYFDAADLIINSENITATDEVHITNFDLLHMTGAITSTTTITGEQLTSTDDITMAGLLTDTMAAVDTTGIYVDGSTNDYTGTATNYGLRVARDVTSSSSTAANSYGGSIAQTVAATLTGSPFVAAPNNYGMSNALTVTGAHTATPSIALSESNYALSNTITRTGTITSTNTTLNSYGIKNAVTMNTSLTYNNAGGTLTINNYGTYSVVTGTPILTNGTLNIVNAGEYIEVAGSGAGSSTNYGIFINSVSAADNNYGIWDFSGADWVLDADNQDIFFGAAQDAKIGFTGTIFQIQSDIITSTDSLLLRGGTNGIDFNIGATEQISLVDGKLFPTTTNDIDLGDSTHGYKDRYYTGRSSQASQSTTLGVGVTTVAITKDFIILTGDAGGNTLATITGGLVGQTLTILFVDALITITDDNTHAANSVDLSAAFTSADDTILELVYDGISWYEVGRSVN